MRNHNYSSIALQRHLCHPSGISSPNWQHSIWQGIKRHAVLVAVDANHSDSEIVTLLNMSRSLVLNVRKNSRRLAGTCHPWLRKTNILNDRTLSALRDSSSGSRVSSFTTPACQSGSYPSISGWQRPQSDMWCMRTSYALIHVMRCDEERAVYVQ